MSYRKTFSRLRKKKEEALVPFVVIGDPDYKTSMDIVKTIIDSGADILELGFPFSDPIADGPTIQAADTRALRKGIDTLQCFKFIQEIRRFSPIPIGLLVYSNLIYQRGIDRFFADCKKAGVDSVLAADVPAEESSLILKSARRHRVDTVFIVSPLTVGKRLDNILSKTRGFVYIVSRLGVTGARKDLGDSTLSLIRRVKRKTKLPLCVGFGISKPEHVQAVLKAGADGAIVGSAVVKIIEKNARSRKRMLAKLGNFIKGMKKATF
jgi:tryptophan synthase alpha chain